MSQMQEHDPFAPFIERANSGDPSEQPLIARIAAALKSTDAELAEVLDISRPTVNLWRHGGGSERYTPSQARTLIERMRLRCFDLQACIDELSQWASQA